MSELIVFLDTCALLYLAADSGRLSSHARELIDRAYSVCISPISAWEISLKCLRNHLRLPIPAEEWFPKAVQQHHLDIVPLSPEVLMKANRLPWHHRDPADRFILASALSVNALLVTTDEVLKDYDIEIVN